MTPELNELREATAAWRRLWDDKSDGTNGAPMRVRRAIDAVLAAAQQPDRLWNDCSSGSFVIAPCAPSDQHVEVFVTAAALKSALESDIQVRRRLQNDGSHSAELQRLRDENAKLREQLGKATDLALNPPLQVMPDFTVRTAPARDGARLRKLRSVCSDNLTKCVEAGQPIYRWVIREIDRLLAEPEPPANVEVPEDVRKWSRSWVELTPSEPGEAKIPDVARWILSIAGKEPAPAADAALRDERDKLRAEVEAHRAKATWLCSAHQLADDPSCAVCYPDLRADVERLKKQIDDRDYLLGELHKERERIVRILGLPLPPETGHCLDGYPDLSERLRAEVERLTKERKDILRDARTAIRVLACELARGGDRG